MSAIVRLTLLAHGMTEANSAGRFPANEPLSDLGARQVRAARRTGSDADSAERVLAGPEDRTRQTAELCGWMPQDDPALADLDYGRWRGESLTSVDPAALNEWMTDPTSAPHGGESLTALMERTADWLDIMSTAAGRVVAVTHPAVIRAAILIVLHAPSESFWRIAIPPASHTDLHHRKVWTLRTR